LAELFIQSGHNAVCMSARGC